MDKLNNHSQQEVDARPVWSLTTEEFRKVLREELGDGHAINAPVSDVTASKYIYGLNGIRKEFGVGHNTAQRLKDTVLRDAVLQAGPGCKVIVDLEMARRLYRDYKEREGVI